MSGEVTTTQKLTVSQKRDAVIHLTQYMKLKWAEETQLDASFYGAFHGDAGGGRDLLEEFLANCDKLLISPTPGCDPSVVTSFLAFKKILRNLLNVDMTKPANRKGDVPRALALTSRNAPGTRVPHRVIYLSVLHATEDMGLLDQRKRAIAELVAEAAAASGLFEAVDGSFSPQGVETIYDRMLVEERGQ